jgi:glycosyltransferase involved in cell wall biosynthesis
VGSVSDVLENQVSGFLTHNRNERIEAISQLSKNPELRAQMGQRGSEIAHERFGAKQFLVGHIHAYEAALAAK